MICPGRWGSGTGSRAGMAQINVRTMWSVCNKKDPGLVGKMLVIV
jgi:hypothetical protein